MKTKMFIAGSSGLFLCILFMLFPLRLFAQQSEDTQVALFPFWGAEEEAVAQFGVELYEAMLEKEDFRPIWIDMSDLPPDIPPGGFPPSVSPSPALTGDAPFAITGTIFHNPQGHRHLRLYLWKMADNRPLFIDEMIAENREIVNVIMPFMLRWLFTWIPDDEPPVVVLPPPPPPPTILEGQHMIVYRDGIEVPDRWLYLGLRAGGNVQIFDPQLFYTGSIFDDGWRTDDLDFHFESVSAAIHLHLQFLGIRLDPSILFLGLQIEGIATQDFGNEMFSLTLPALLRLTLRRGTSSFSLLGGAYMFMPLSLFWDEPGIRFRSDESIGPFAGWGYAFGFSMGNRVGPGNLFVEMRWSNDMFTSRIVDYSRRNVASVSVGYELGLFNRRR